jgi:hypothetical protein
VTRADAVHHGVHSSISDAVHIAPQFVYRVRHFPERCRGEFWIALENGGRAMVPNARADIAMDCCRRCERVSHDGPACRCAMRSAAFEERNARSVLHNPLVREFHTAI